MVDFIFFAENLPATDRLLTLYHTAYLSCRRHLLTKKRFVSRCLRRDNM